MVKHESAVWQLVNDTQTRSVSFFKREMQLECSSASHLFKGLASEGY